MAGTAGAELTEPVQRNVCLKRVLWIFYMIYLVFVVFFTVLRFMTLLKNKGSLDDIMKANTFPTGCSSWASTSAGNCTRIVKKQSGCVRYDTLTKYWTAWDEDKVDAAMLNSKLSKCIGTVSGAKLHEPSDLASKTTYVPLIHVSFASTIFGFIDDTYISTYNDDP